MESRKKPPTAPSQQPRRAAHGRRKPDPSGRKFNYELSYATLNVRENPDVYRVGVGEQGVLLVEPYKSEILPLWRFKTPDVATVSSAQILRLFYDYRDRDDFIGMDMARKFLQMGFTRARRYANHASGRKYGADGAVLPTVVDAIKAESAAIFRKAWDEAEAEPLYKQRKADWKKRLG